MVVATDLLLNQQRYNLNSYTCCSSSPVILNSIRLASFSNTLISNNHTNQLNNQCLRQINTMKFNIAVKNSLAWVDRLVQNSIEHLIYG